MTLQIFFDKMYFHFSSFHSRLRSSSIFLVKRPWDISCSVNFFFGEIIFLEAKDVLARLSKDVPNLDSLSVSDDVDDVSVVSVAVELCCQRLNLFWGKI